MLVLESQVRCLYVRASKECHVVGTWHLVAFATFHLRANVHSPVCSRNHNIATFGVVAAAWSQRGWDIPYATFLELGHHVGVTLPYPLDATLMERGDWWHRSKYVAMSILQVVAATWHCHFQ